MVITKGAQVESDIQNKTFILTAVFLIFLTTKYIQRGTATKLKPQKYASY